MTAGIEAHPALLLRFRAGILAFGDHGRAGVGALGADNVVELDDSVTVESVIGAEVGCKLVHKSAERVVQAEAWAG